jgi:hypothetical protein
MVDEGLDPEAAQQRMERMGRSMFCIQNRTFHGVL